MPERILMLSWTVPPETTGSAVIVGNLAKQFSRAEMVIAGELPRDRPPVTWKDEWPEIHYVSKGWAATARGARWWRRLQIPLLVWRCFRLMRSHGCTQIMVVFPCEEYLLAGYLVALLSGARLYPYFHNTYVEQCEPGTVHSRVAACFQSLVFARARHIFVMSEGMVQLYRERYPRTHCSALLHSFNEDIPDSVPPPAPMHPVRCVLAGNINHSCSDAAIRLAAAVNGVGGSLSILSGTPKAYLQKLGIIHEAVTYDTVSRDLILSRLREGDILLLAHGFTGQLSDDEYRTIFPTKTIEYLISGRPILAHTPPGCYLTSFLRKHECALVVDQADQDALVAALQRLCEDATLRDRLVRNALRTARRFRASMVAASLRALLDGHAGEGERANSGASRS
jgi:hypothetical protein